jgi:hypothetical protein
MSLGALRLSRCYPVQYTLTDLPRCREVLLILEQPLSGRSQTACMHMSVTASTKSGTAVGRSLSSLADGRLFA